MAAYAGKTQSGMSIADAVAAAVSSGDALGYTADEIADALGLPLDGAVLQHDLEEMVWQGVLNRRGIGRGALYTLAAPLGAKVPAMSGSLTAPALKGSMTQKAG